MNHDGTSSAGFGFDEIDDPVVEVAPIRDVVVDRTGAIEKLLNRLGAIVHVDSTVAS